MFAVVPIGLQGAMHNSSVDCDSDHAPHSEWKERSPPPAFAFSGDCRLRRTRYSSPFVGRRSSTDSSDEARLPQGLVDFAFLQVWLRKVKACQRNSQGELYNLVRIRRDGFSTPNNCGIIRVLDRPGVLTIFTRSGRDSNAHASAIRAGVGASGCCRAHPIPLLWELTHLQTRMKRCATRG
jgi:hypothetical protein